MDVRMFEDINISRAIFVVETNLLSSSTELESIQLIINVGNFLYFYIFLDKKAHTLQLTESFPVQILIPLLSEQKFDDCCL
jgi:hypothetical protein